MSLHIPSSRSTSLHVPSSRIPDGAKGRGLAGTCRDTVGPRSGKGQRIFYFVRQAFVELLSLRLLIPIEVPHEPAKVGEVLRECPILLTQLPDFVIGSEGSVWIIERLTEEIKESVQRVEPDTSSGFGYVRSNQIEGRSQEAVYSVSEAGLVVRITLGL